MTTPNTQLAHINQAVTRARAKRALSPAIRGVSSLALLLAAACSSDGGTTGNEGEVTPPTEGDPMGAADPMGEGGSGGAMGTDAELGGSGGSGGDVGTTEPPVEPTEPPATRECPVTTEVRVALWFPKDDAGRLAADLEQAKSVVSVTVLTGADEPTADELIAGYDAVVVGSDWGFGDQSPDAMGDLLADYVDGGGVVVDTMFNHTTWAGMGTQEALGGRWQSEGYNSITLAGQINAPVSDTVLALTDPSDPLVEGLAPAAFVADLNAMDFIYMTGGAVNGESPLGFVELARWTALGEDHPAIVVSTDADRRVLGLALSPVLNFDVSNEDGTTREFLACSIAQLVQ